MYLLLQFLVVLQFLFNKLLSATRLATSSRLLSCHLIVTTVCFLSRSTFDIAMLAYWLSPVVFRLPARFCYPARFHGLDLRF